MKGPLANTHFTPQNLKQIGKLLSEALIPFSKINTSQFKRKRSSITESGSASLRTAPSFQRKKSVAEEEKRKVIEEPVKVDKMNYENLMSELIQQKEQFKDGID